MYSDSEIARKIKSTMSSSIKIRTIQPVDITAISLKAA
jgi:hypothetical protein